MNRRILILTAALLAIGAVSLPVYTRKTNCGGNSAAGANCAIVATWLSTESAHRTAGTMSFLDPSPELRQALPNLARTSWLPGARFLVLAEPFRLKSSEPPRIVYVCDRPYTNVPERFFFSAPPTHAAVLSNGNSVLISTTEFAALDLSRYRDLKELYPNPTSK